MVGFHWIWSTASFSPLCVPLENWSVSCCCRLCSSAFCALSTSPFWISCFCCWSVPPAVCVPLITMQSAPFGFSNT